MTLLQKFQVFPNQIGCLFYQSRLKAKLEPGIYRYWNWRKDYQLLNISQTYNLQSINNQEILTKDNIALRCSFMLIYQVGDIDKLLSVFDISNALRLNREEIIFAQVTTRLSACARLRLREIVTNISSEELTDRRMEFTDFQTPEMIATAESLGIHLISTYLVDITFPKTIQDLFARQLESKIRARFDLENARTAVATARTLKNAAELIKDNPQISFLQFLETLNKLATTGKHTFVIGDLDQFMGSKNGG